jgi:hypothetical protein
MSNIKSRVEVTGLTEALQTTLDDYSAKVLEGVDGASYRAADKLLKLTKATAPVGFRKKFRRSIAVKEIYKDRGKYRGRTYVWHVKPPDHRLTHLLVHGHATKDGGRTKADPFLQNALDKVVPEYLEEVEDALKWK